MTWCNDLNCPVCAMLGRSPAVAWHAPYVDVGPKRSLYDELAQALTELKPKVGDRVRVEPRNALGWKGVIIEIVRGAPVVLGDDGRRKRVSPFCVALLTKPKAPVLDDGDADTVEQNEVKK